MAHSDQASASTFLKIRQERMEKVKKLREMGINPYPAKSSRNTMTQEIGEKFTDYKNKEVTVAGRVMTWRDFGKLKFADLQDGTGQIQLYFKGNSLLPTSKERQNIGWDDLELLDIGDIVEATGTVVKTKTGEISVQPKTLRIIAKSIRPLPDKHKGVQDEEMQSRQKYLTTIMDPQKRWRYEKSAQVLYAIRRFLYDRGFLEIKTPILQPIYGGGLAEPFRTKMQALGEDFFLAISHEIYLKRLITAGFEKVFNLQGYFRNEGIDKTHNPEFMMLETMSAFENYEYNMDLIEEMYQYITKEVFGTTEFDIYGHKVDFAKPWTRISMSEAVKNYSGVDFNEITTLQKAHDVLKKFKINEFPGTVGESLVLMYEETVESKLKDPTFILGHPVEISPLSKRRDDDPRYVERFEINIGGFEGGDNWTELNDPQELLERFKDQQRRRAEGDKESFPMDLDFIEMMEYGMPPTSGLGPGIERLVMTLTNTNNIDDVIFFPIVKPAPVIRQQREIYGLDELEKELTAMGGTSLAEDYEKQKAVIVLSAELEKWQMANVIGHLNLSLGQHVSEDILGQHKLTDASGKIHRGISRYPVIALQAKSSQLSKLVNDLRESGLVFVDYPQEMLDTRTDDDLRAALQQKPSEEIKYLGVVVFGPTDEVDKLTKKFSLLK